MNNEAAHIAIVILAAGASKRMGSSKQLLKWGTSTLIEHAIQTALNTNAEDVVVVLGANYQLVKKEIDQFSITILNNKDWEEGLGKSIAFAINHILGSKSKVDGVLIMLADQPFIDVDFLNKLITQFEVDKDFIIATSYEKGKYGVPVIFDKVYFEALSKLDDDNGAKHILKKHKSRVKALIPPVKNVDLDSKEDYLKQHRAKFKN